MARQGVRTLCSAKCSMYCGNILLTTPAVILLTKTLIMVGMHIYVNLETSLLGESFKGTQF